MSLRPYQQRIVDTIMNELAHYNKPFVISATQGAGKSWIIGEVAKQVGKCLILCMNKELVEQDAEKVRAVGAECSIYSASCGEKVISDITVATIGSIYKHPEYCMGFDLVIIDECFFAGTKVDGRNIEDYKVGDVVRSYNFATGKIEKKRVSRVIRKKSPEKMYCIKVSGRSIISTGNHQHYTSSGWKRADEIKEGDTIYENADDKTCKLFDLRKDNQTAGHKPKPTKTLLQKWKNVLLGYVREDGYQQSLIAKTKRPQSQKQKTGSDTKTIANKKNKRGSTYMDYAPRAKRGEWKTQRAAKDSLEGAGQGMDARSCNTNGATKGHWVPYLLQGRPGECNGNACNRVRWTKPQWSGSTDKRQKENKVIRELRVDGVEILERENYGRLGLSDNGDYVYCISVEDNHNFFANGILTHNCDSCPVDKKDSMYMKLFSQIKKPVIGLTGTAFRTAYNYSRLKNGDVVQSTVIKSLDNFKFWGKVIDGVGYQELLDEKFLSPIQYYVEDTNMSMLRVNSTGLDYTEDSLEKYGGANRMRLVQVVRGAVDVWKCKRVLVAVPNIEEAERVAEILRANGVRAESLHSQMSKKERTRIVERFKNGQIKVVVQVLILNVGFDLPALDCVIFARPSLSLRIWCQFCYTKSMNILTPRGFLSCDDIHEGDLVYAYNIETGKIEATPVLEKIERPLMDGEKVYQYKNPHIDVSMTENHDLVYRARRATHWKKEQLRAVMDKMMDCYEVPVAGFETPHGTNSLTDYELKLIGWFLSDGYIEKNTNRIGISQSDANKEYVKEIKEILDKLNIGYTFTKNKRTGKLSKYSPCNHFRFSKRTNKPGKRGAGFMWEWLDKTMSHECFESLTHDQLKIIMETMFKGDGAKQRTVGGPKGSYAICIGDKPFAEKLQSLLIRRGFSAKIATYKSKTGWSDPNKELKMLYYSEKITRTLNGKNVLRRNTLGESIRGRKYKRSSWELEEYTGNVWCVRTKLGTTIMERNGKVIIAGNCARGIRLDPDDKTKTCKCIDMGGMIKLYGRIEDVKVKGGKVIGTHGYISDKILNKVNVSEMARRFN